MKIDRRVFLSFIAGGAAGSALSPLPWKLMDDFSIWSQNWPWVPIPQDGKMTSINTICSLCPGSCGITVNKVGDRAIKIDGVKNHPVNDGNICSLGLSGLQLLYGPTRVKSPMQRLGDRGSGRWQKISWNKAMSIVASNLSSIRSDGDAHKVACISGSHQGTVSLLMQRFLQSYGSANFIKMPSGYDINRLALKVLCGESNPIIDFDIENSDFILSFGADLVDGWHSPVKMMKSIGKHIGRDEIRLFQVEDKLSNTAAKADQWIPINPGTESDLALGISSFIITNKLYNKEILENTTGFDELEKTLLSKYPLNSVSETTGVDVDVISKLSKSFLEANNSIALCGRGKGNIPASFKDYISVHLLNILKGNFNKKGGVWLSKEWNYFEWPSSCLDDISKEGFNFGRIDEAGSDDYPYSEHLVNNMITNIESGKHSLRALFITDSNPCHTLHDTASTKRAFRSVPLVVSFSSFMDETVAESDLVLPNHTYLERLEDVPVLNDSGELIVGLSKPVVIKQHDTQHLGETIIKIAHMLGGSIAKSFPWSSYENCLRDSLGNRWESTKDKKKPWIEEKLETVNLEKINFNKIKLMETKIEGNPDLFPFVLLPSDSINLPSGYIAAPPFLIKTIANTVIEGGYGFIDINPQTAEMVGLSQRDYAFLLTPKGKKKVKVNINEGLKPGVITMPRGLGHTAYDKYVSNKGVNVNDLIGSVKDSVIGHDSAWGIRAKLVKA